MQGKAELFCDSRCELGEGPFWHPHKNRLFWFDIPNCALLSADAEGHVVDRITFPEPVSAAGVIDPDGLAVAQAGALLRYDFATDRHAPIVAIEPDRPGNRTNDSRVDRAGGFWIGTMSRRGGQEPKAGSVWHFRHGHLNRILSEVTTPNSICFSPDGRTAYFTDGGASILKCATDPETGMPIGEWSEFVSGIGHGIADGSVVDAEGFVWNARWRGGCVIRFAPDGRIDRIVEVPASRVTCPAFGGPRLTTLYLTTAREGLTPEELEREPEAGSVFAVELDVPGLLDPPVRL